MSIKTILACLTSESSADAVMTAACALARRHDAHLIGLRTIEALMVYPGIALHIPDSAHDDYGSSQLEQTEALKAVFEKYTHAEQFVSEWRTVRTGMAMAADRIAESAGCADIVVIAGGGTDIHQSADMKLLETVIHDSGRPVLVVPPTARPDTLGRSVLIGWNGTREAVRAAHDVLSLLQEGDIAHIVHVNDSSHGADQDATSRELAAAFARHGVETTLVQKTWTHPGVATALNKEAFERGADMIAIGAFGHSRAYDFIIGTATRDLLGRSDLPVLFSR
ncbi:MAG: universal stress protein [Jannaschia helgolandensis]